MIRALLCTYFDVRMSNESIPLLQTSLSTTHYCMYVNNWGTTFNWISRYIYVQDCPQLNACWLQCPLTFLVNITSLLARSMDIKGHKGSSLFCSSKRQKYYKNLKISLGAYVFQRPFLRGLILEGLIFGGLIVGNCVTKPTGLAYISKVNLKKYVLPYYFCHV